MPRGKKPVVQVEGQLAMGPEKPPEFQSYPVALDQIHDPLLGATNVKPQFVESIRKLGVLFPVLLRKTSGDGPPTYRVIAGRRRIRASILAGKQEVPARIPIDDDGWTDDALLALHENEQRSDNPIATLAHIEDMMVRGYSEKDVAKAVGVDLKVVRKYLGLQRLNPKLMAAFVSGTIGVGVAEQASKLPAAYQGKLAAILADTGTLKGSDLRTVKEVKKRDVENALPESLFDDTRLVDAPTDFIDAVESSRDDVVSKGAELVDRLIHLFPGLEAELLGIKAMIAAEGGTGVADIPEIRPVFDPPDNGIGTVETTPYEGEIRVPVVTSSGSGKGDDFQIVSEPSPDPDDQPY